MCIHVGCYLFFIADGYEWSIELNIRLRDWFCSVSKVGVKTQLMDKIVSIELYFYNS